MKIPEYFKGKKILITGATGFMGKALVEKLLRSCPDVSEIYVVVRPKKGSSPEERWAEIAKLPLFDKLRLKYPNALDKVVTIPGESTAANFGISEANVKLLVENVNIVYHVAASVRFTEELVSALKLNLQSTYSILEIAKKMKHLECFVHTSTAYSNIEKNGTVEERVYESPLDWRMMLKLAQNSAYHDLLPSIQPKIMSGHETTYTLTKRIAESLVEEYSNYFPVVMMRPALVISTAEDPIPGWLDSHNALTLVADAIRCGIVRIANFDSDKSLQFVTLDLSIKAFLIATWNVHEKRRRKGVEVYCTSMGNGKGNGMSMNWGDLHRYGFEICEDYPAARQLWHPFCLRVKNSFFLGFLFFFLQVVPAVVGDLVNVARGLKPQFFALTTKFYKALTGPLQGFAKRDFPFSRENYENLESLLAGEDKEAFSIDQSKYTPLELYKTNALGMIKYVVQEDTSPEALKKRRQRSQKFKMLHNSVTAALIATGCYVTLNIVTALA